MINIDIMSIYIIFSVTQEYTALIRYIKYFKLEIKPIKLIYIVYW
jgi:hypothetical protein